MSSVPASSGGDIGDHAALESLRIEAASESDAIAWDAFVEQSADASFYHRYGWRRIIEKLLHHRCYYLVARSGNDIVGILPLVQVKSLLFGNSLISIPFLVYGGAVARDEAVVSALVARAAEIGAELGVDNVELRFRSPIDCLGTEWLELGTHATFRKTISADVEENLKSIPRKQRAMIRKAQSYGLQYAFDNDTSRLYSAMLECKRNLGTPFFNGRYLQAIKDEFGEAVEVLTVTKDQEIVCSVMSFRFRDEILPYYGGGGDIARGLKGNDFMYWCVMQEACQAGVTVFDFGRSQIDSGAYRFKKHWGFEPEPLGYRMKLIRATEPPNLSPNNPKFQAAVRTWQKLPLFAAALIGPPIARRLG